MDVLDEEDSFLDNDSNNVGYDDNSNVEINDNEKDYDDKYTDAR